MEKYEREREREREMREGGRERGGGGGERGRESLRVLCLGKREGETEKTNVRVALHLSLA